MLVSLNQQLYLQARGAILSSCLLLFQGIKTGATLYAYESGMLQQSTPHSSSMGSSNCGVECQLCALGCDMKEQLACQLIAKPPAFSNSRRKVSKVACAGSRMTMNSSVSMKSIH